LIGIGLGFAAVEAAARRDAALDDSEGVVQKHGIGEGTSEGEGVLTNGLGRFEEATVGERPATDQKEPMLDDHGEQLGEDLTQNAPGVGTARLINVAVAFPQLEEEFNGMITNDKFCTTRACVLPLSWWRCPKSRRP